MQEKPKELAVINAEKPKELAQEKVEEKSISLAAEDKKPVVLAEKPSIKAPETIQAVA